MEVRVPLADESVAARPFLTDMYMRKVTDGRIEIGIAKKGGDDYAWAAIPVGDLRKALALLGVSL